jgi:coenzyme F420-0:L-glutamate ligase/coenzyme F420-1:gamma-L-glutamate ligase
MRVELVPIHGIPEVRRGDDLGRLIADAVRRGGGGALARLEDGDVVVVTQKVVSKAEGRVVPEQPEGKAGWVARETRRVVARRGELVISETRHGFVCANAGVDASNVGHGWLSLLPDDPDASAERIRRALASAAGAAVGVVVTDTFGRAWRTGLVDVAIGCAGVPSVVDLRGSKDATGRVLDVTVVALADQLAAASGLVMGKADGVPAAVVRGARLEGPVEPASALLRPPEEDLFRETPLQAVRSARPASGFGPGEISREAVLEAVAAARSVPEPDGSRPWSLAAAWSEAARRRVLGDLVRGGGPAAEAAGRLSGAGCFILPAARAVDEDDRAPLLAGGAFVQRLLLALHAQGFACRWEAQLAGPAEGGWLGLGVLGVGARMPATDPFAEPLFDPASSLRELD